MAESRIQKFIRSLIKTLGIKRKLSAAFQTLALIISFVPGIAPYAGILTAIAGWLGLAGVTHNLVKTEVIQETGRMMTAEEYEVGSLPLATLAAFFNALVLAADTVPELAPYRNLFFILASILSALSSGTTLVGMTIAPKEKPTLQRDAHPCSLIRRRNE